MSPKFRDAVASAAVFLVGLAIALLAVFPTIVSCGDDNSKVVVQDKACECSCVCESCDSAGAGVDCKCSGCQSCPDDPGGRDGVDPNDGRPGCPDGACPEPEG